MLILFRKWYTFRLDDITTLKILHMNSSTQSENNNSHFNREIERQKAIKALEKAKNIKRKVVFLPQGATGNPNFI